MKVQDYLAEKLREAIANKEGMVIELRCEQMRDGSLKVRGMGDYKVEVTITRDSYRPSRLGVHYES